MSEDGARGGGGGGRRKMWSKGKSVLNIRWVILGMKVAGVNYSFSIEWRTRCLVF